MFSMILALQILIRKDWTEAKYAKWNVALGGENKRVSKLAKKSQNASQILSFYLPVIFHWYIWSIELGSGPDSKLLAQRNAVFAQMLSFYCNCTCWCTSQLKPPTKEALIKPTALKLQIMSLTSVYAFSYNLLIVGEKGLCCEWWNCTGMPKAINTPQSKTKIYRSVDLESSIFRHSNFDNISENPMMWLSGTNK